MQVVSNTLNIETERKKKEFISDKDIIFFFLCEQNISHFMTSLP